MATEKFVHRKLIVKADDFGRGPFMDPWRKFVDVCLDAGVDPSIGIVGSDFISNGEARSLARYFQDAHNIEFWNHSFNHSDVRKLTAEQRVKDTTRCQEVIRDALGSEPTIYGAPFNYIDQDSVNDIGSAGGFKGFYFADSAPASVRNIPIRFMCTPEVGTQFLSPVRYGYFKNVIERREYPSLVVVQVHPSYWTGESFDEFRRVLRLLAGKSYQAMNASEYFSYLDASSGRKAAINIGSATAISECIYTASGTGENIPLSFSPSDREYYFGRYKRGVAELSRFLRMHGLANRESSKQVDVLDS